MSDGSAALIFLAGIALVFSWIGHGCGKRSVMPADVPHAIHAPGLGSDQAQVRHEAEGVYVRLNHSRPWTLAIPQHAQVQTPATVVGDHRLIATVLGPQFLPVLVQDGYSERCYVVLDAKERVWSFRIHHGELRSHSYLLSRHGASVDPMQDRSSIDFIQRPEDPPPTMAW